MPELTPYLRRQKAARRRTKAARLKATADRISAAHKAWLKTKRLARKRAARQKAKN